MELDYCRLKDLEGNSTFNHYSNITLYSSNGTHPSTNPYKFSNFLYFVYFSAFARTAKTKKFTRAGHPAVVNVRN